MKDKKQTKQQNITKRQTEIITYLLRFRYLTRPQIQTLLNHKSKDYVSHWLNDLTHKTYLYTFYDKKFAGKPAVYCLDKGAIPYLTQQEITGKIIKRIYTEKTHSQVFQEHSIFIAVIYLSLSVLTKETGATLYFHTKHDLGDVQYLPLPKPDAYVAIKENTTISRYFLDIFDDSTFMKKRVHQYLAYYKQLYWQNHRDKSFPKIILFCPNRKIQRILYHFIKKNCSDDSPVFFLTSADVVQKQGMCREVLQKVA